VRVVVVGASGNVGTAVLRRLSAEPSVDTVVGVARRLQEALRNIDTCARVGGDEFVIVCAAATADACKALADRLVMLSEALGKTYRLPSVPKLSAGWGLLSESPDASAAALVALAPELTGG